MNRRRFLAAVAGGASVLVVGAPAVAADPARAPYGSGPLGDWTTYSPSISTPTQFANVQANNGIMLIGDSIAKANAYQFATRAWADHALALAVNAWPSRPTAPAVDWLETNAGYVPDRGVVMAAGSNDIFRPLGWWQQVERVMTVAAGRPVYWVSVYVDRWAGTAARRVADMRNSGVINNQLYTMAKAYPNLTIVEWHAALAGGHNESNIDAWLDDGVHCTSTGRDAWCDLIEQGMGL